MPHDAHQAHHKGFAFLEFEDEGAASLALATMHGFPLAGRRIKVSRPQSLGISMGGSGGSGAGGMAAAAPPPPSKADSVAAAAAVATAAAAAAGRGHAAAAPSPMAAVWDERAQHGAAPPAATLPALQALHAGLMPPSAPLSAPHTPASSSPLSQLSSVSPRAPQLLWPSSSFVLLADFHPSLTSDDVSSIAAAFGEVKACQVRAAI